MKSTVIAIVFTLCGWFAHAEYVNRAMRQVAADLTEILSNLDADAIIDRTRTGRPVLDGDSGTINLNTQGAVLAAYIDDNGNIQTLTAAALRLCEAVK